ncbi:trypsin-like serine protease [Anabaenopsis circularis NIES-21]|uniref:Trypsin-like serine protease n=1 Tax=Anabaenopsis circularis NIES-21 TaxID=1085406 RepID=A0A1Z4GEL4_9CYAN|nr:trypsin-like serine protease [Anabaenopsis circularis NIES-21]
MEWHYFVSGQEELVDKVISFFTSKCTNTELFQDIVTKCKNNPLSAPNNSNHRVAINLGYLSVNDFLYYESRLETQKGIPIAIVEIILKRLCQELILFEQQLLGFGHNMPYSLNEDFTQFLCSRGLLKNVIFGFNYIVQNYQNSVFKIVVTADSGNPAMGTGFLFNIQTSDAKKYSIIITNEHVAKYQEGLQIHHKDGRVEIWKEIIIAEKIDLAAIILDSYMSLPSFHLFPNPKILDDIVTVGYPPVPTANERYQLVHKGEINCFLTNFWNQNYFLFSARTSPGNSGGPVINSMGMVVGIVTEQLFEPGSFEQKGQLPYFAAVPSVDILEFLNEMVFTKLQ